MTSVVPSTPAVIPTPFATVVIASMMVLGFLRATLKTCFSAAATPTTSIAAPGTPASNAAAPALSGATPSLIWSL